MTKAAMAVQRYLKKHGLKVRQLSQRSRVHEGVFSHVLCGRRKRFSQEAALRIHKVCPDELSLADLMGLTDAGARGLNGAA